MNEPIKNDIPPVAPQNDSDVVALVKKIQQQLVFLEKKIDILIGQSSERPFQRREFPKPFRPLSGPASPGGGRQAGFNRSHHYGKGERGHPREGGFGGGPRYFDKPQGGENRGFGGHKKKPFFRKRKEQG